MGEDRVLSFLRRPALATSTTQLLGDLVAIDSRNPALVPGAPGEAAAGAFVARFLRDTGLEVTVVDSQSGRPSIIGHLRGTGGGKTLLLNGHYDTVGFGAMEEPLVPRIEAGRLYGRGSYDMKGGLVAVLAAAAELARGEQLKGDLVVAAVADEEHASIGTEAILEYLKAAGIQADYGIVAEPTEHALCVAHKGFVWATITTHGRAAHGSAYLEGIDAIVQMGHVLVALEQLGKQFQEREPHPLLKHSSVHASLISGGVELSTYPAHCELQIERRLLPGETPETLVKELDTLLDSIRAVSPEFQAEYTLGLARSPMEAGLDSPLVVELLRAAEQIQGTRPEPFGMGGWTDASLMAGAGIPSVLFGPTGEGAHADVEWVDLASVASCAEVFVATARALCG